MGTSTRKKPASDKKRQRRALTQQAAESLSKSTQESSAGSLDTLSESPKPDSANDSERNKGGRPSKKTPEVVKDLCFYISDKCLLTRRACGMVGVAYRTMLQWQAEDEVFAYQIAQAKAQRSNRLTELALAGIPGLSNNAVTLLRWLDQEDAEAKAIKLQGDAENPIKVEEIGKKLDSLSLDDLRALAAGFKDE